MQSEILKGTGHLRVILDCPNHYRILKQDRLLRAETFASRNTLRSPWLDWIGFESSDQWTSIELDSLTSAMTGIILKCNGILLDVKQANLTTNQLKQNNSIYSSDHVQQLCLTCVPRVRTWRTKGYLAIRCTRHALGGVADRDIQYRHYPQAAKSYVLWWPVQLSQYSDYYMNWTTGEQRTDYRHSRSCFCSPKPSDLNWGSPSSYIIGTAWKVAPYGVEAKNT
jgi:hypothetical protein